MTYKEAYEKGKNMIVSEEAGSEALLLLEYLMNTERNDLFIHPDRILDETKEKEYFDLIERRQKGEPVQYITGRTFFYGLEFVCNRSVLIPRFDTEILVERIIKTAPFGLKLLDLCTGSGCIALAVKDQRKDLTVVGSDISKEALDTAKVNREKLNLDAEFIQSDLFENINEKFDIIVSNPPYIERKVIEGLEEQVKDFEPRSALDGGVDGLDFYRRIIKEAPLHFVNDGRVMFEIGYDQKEGVSLLLEENGYKEINTIKDLNGLDRVVTAVYER
ncbi:MAG: peptide chain release factor N(5)-glutamine methyltransferase [Lachnospiraceae bacterium]|nr:peptide chain release factor N(5)-glutamine methyltransferase [Lachnospiraceae bacterium]